MKRVLLVATGDTIAHLRYFGRPGIASGTELIADAAVDKSVADVCVEDE
jgi:L-asparaginase